MKTAICVAAYVAAFLLAPRSDAQTASETSDKDQLPPGPLIVPAMPTTAQWTIELTYKEPSTPESAAAKLASFKRSAEKDPVLAKELANPQFAFAITMPRPQRIIVTKSGDLRHQAIEYERGYKGDIWLFNGFLVTRLPSSPVLNAVVSVEKAKDFPEFNWISRENFTGLKKVGPTECLSFKQDLPPMTVLAPVQFARENGGEMPKTGPQMVPVIAYIDVQTRTPVALVLDGEPRRYTIDPPLTTPIFVPADFAAAAKDAKTRVDAATKTLSPP